MKKLGIILAILLVPAMIFASGAPETAQTTAETTVAAEVQKEAPMLAAKVAAGELPALEDRLPVASDVYVEDLESVGAYGEKLTMSYDGKSSQWMVGKIMEENLFAFNSQGELVPNVAKGFDVNEDSTVYTIYLREGMKWSDGVPFTSEDVLFFYYHMCIPKTFGKSLFECFYSTNPETLERTQCEMEAVDDYTVKVTFADPAPKFLENVAINSKWLYAPAHYYKNLLPEFIGEEAAAAKAAELGYKDVAAMGKETGYYFWNVVGRPTLRAWVTTADRDADLLVYTRNPYYWKVDAEGKQLPYEDEFHFVKVSDANQHLLMAMSGETDLYRGSMNDIVTLKQNQANGGYTFYYWPSTSWGSVSTQLQFNLTCQDDNLRALFNNADFRQALSISVDREEMVSLCSEFAEPAQCAPEEGQNGYDPEWSKKWTEYDPEKAKALLEGCGLVMGSDGYYNFADGSDFILEMLTCKEGEEITQIAELLTQKYFKNIGVKATFSLRDRSLIEDMAISNSLTAVLSPVAPMDTVNITLRPDTLVPVRNYAVWYGTYGDWVSTNGEKGMEPTGDMAELINLYKQMNAATSREEIAEIGKKMLELHKENVWAIGFYTSSPMVLVVDADLKNFHEVEVNCDEFRELNLAKLWGCYFESDKK
jgi:peptide/nickel transport system substrate-binding protein